MRYRATKLLVAATLATLGTIPAAIYSQEARVDRIGGHPNLNGMWEALNTAYWNLEAHPAVALKDFWKLGAFGAIPAGQSVVEGGAIPYLPDALAQRDKNRAGWPASDPAAKCYLPGIPRATYQPFPFQIIQGDGDILFVYQFASANRPVYMSEKDHLSYDQVPVDQWMGWSNGSWDGDTLVVQVIANDDRTWFDRSGNYHSNALTVTEHYTLIDKDHIQYEATIDDPKTYSRPWTISMPLYRHVEPNAEMLEYKCVEFSEDLLYGKYLKNPPE